METLTSLKNPKVQLWRSLKDTGVRRECGLFLVEGRKSVAEAMEAGFPVEALLLTEGMAVPQGAQGMPCYCLPEHVMAAVCDTKTPQGIAAVLHMTAAPVTGRRLVALDGVQDPGNVGTIIRTADAAGMDGVLMSRACADPFSPKVLRATMGSIFHLPVQVTDDLPGVLAGKREAGMTIISSQLDGAPFYGVSYGEGGFVLVVGSEGNGVTDEVKALSTLHLKLPMRGKAESLNVAVAAGIMMYELTRE